MKKEITINGRKIGFNTEPYIIAELSGNHNGDINRAIKLIDAAVASAKEALPGWAGTPPAKRAQVMFKFRELIIQNLDELAGLISAQHGKTLDDARGEVAG